MAGDYTRFTYRPEDDHSAVLMQQGRVQLDADWNELVELFERRLRVETVDVIGRAGVPKQTLQGFRIGGTVSSGLTIGVGRCYVDGLLAENRGVGNESHEPVWGERTHQAPTPYVKQPYLFPAPNPPSGTGPHLAYLDVWERELTAAEDPDLVEPAVGVDTATRLQTVWAVRIAANVGAGVTCDSDWDNVAEWAKLTRPSGARLTSGAQGAAAPADPCHVSPAGGYRGVDNRLYRVEVHDDGSVTGRPPSFKWSRDNGAVAAEMRSMSDETQTVVTLGVRRVGRDGTLRFKDGDWVELTDDQRELSGLPGVMGKIAPNGVDAQANELTLVGPLDAKVDATRHARVRRWDQQAGVNANHGVIEIGTTPTATPFELEHGVKVSFDLEAPGTWHVGDYWVFAARAGAEQGTVEELDREPPRGIRHHYCRLAVIEDGAPTDCRVLYPPDPPDAHACCDCDICVSPSSHADGTLTIQDAIDKIEKTGGKVCLGVGTYKIKETIRIWGARSLTFAGKGVRTVIDHQGRGPAVDIFKSTEVTMDHIAMAGSRGKGTEVDIGVAIRNSVGVTIQRCFLGEAAALTGVKTKSASKASTRGGAGIAIGLAGFLAEVAIRENVVLADIGVAALPALGPLDPADGARSIGNKNAASWSSLKKGLKAAKIEQLQSYLVTHGLWIEDNLFACERVGVDLGRGGRLAAGTDAVAGLVLYLGETRVAGNAIYLCTEAGILAAGIVPAERSVLVRELGAELDKLVASVLKVSVAGGVKVSLPNMGGAALAAATSGARLEIVRNQLAVLGWGVVHACDQTRVAGNDVGAFASAAGLSSGGGIAVLIGPRGTVLSGVEIVDNRVRGVGSHGIAVLTGVESARVCDNTVERVGGCGVFTASAAPSTVVVSGNQLIDVARTARLGYSGVAILITGADRVDIESNLIDRVGGDDVTTPVRGGIIPLMVRECRVSGNEVRSLGPNAEFTGTAQGIMLSNSFQRALVDGNIVRLESGTGAGKSGVLALFVAGGGLTIIMNKVAGFGEGNVWAEDFAPFPDPKEGSNLSVHGNMLEASGRFSPVVINVNPGSLAFGDNVCRFSGPGAQASVASITVRGAGLSLTSNHFYGPAPMSVSLSPQWTGSRYLFTAVGNISNGTLNVGGSPIPAPWNALNIRV
jgi:hypothetical protein